MDTVNLKILEDGTVWVTTDEDPVGKKFTPDRKHTKEETLLLALADFLGFGPMEIINLKD